MAKKRGNNEGSIYKREDGGWRAQITLDGNRLSFSAKSYQECREWLKSTVRSIDSGLTFDKAQIEFGDFLTDWLTSSKTSLRPKTWHQYNQITRDYIMPSFARIKLVDLRPDLIQKLYDKKVAEGLGLRTIQLIHAVIRRNLNRAVKLGILERNVAEATTPPKTKPREMQILDEGQVQLLLHAVKETNMRLKALFELTLTTGMRQGELLGLKWNDVDWNRKSIHVIRQLRPEPGGGLVFDQPKTKAGTRTISLGDAMMSNIKGHYDMQFAEIKTSGGRWQDLDLIFPSSVGTPLHPRNLIRRFRNILKVSGLPIIRFHDLRHTAASLMLNHGIPVLVVSKRLGHAKPSITLDVYGHLLPSMQEQAAAIMDEVLIPLKLDDITPVAPGLHRSESDPTTSTKNTPHIQAK